MKKTLSVLLSLLMVLGCMTCLFTMPASAVEAPSTEPAVESLPDNLLVPVEGSEGRQYSFSKELIWKEFYQLDVVVTADEEDTNEYFFPTLLSSAGASMNYYHISGVRYTAADPTNVETAYNNVGNQPGNIYKAPNGVVDESKVVAAKNVAGTYIYTYIVSPATGAEGISFPENVTIESANLFELKNTSWNDFFWEGNKVFRYMVKEGNNVFQRFYGYRDVGAAAVTTGNGVGVSANIEGNLYNIEVKEGSTYTVDYDLRLASNTANVNWAPGVNLYDVEFFDMREEYKAIRDQMVAEGAASADAEGKILGVDEYKYVAGGLEGQGFLQIGYSWGGASASGYYCLTEQGHIKPGQVICDSNRNGYSNSNWALQADTGFVRRVSTQNIASLMVNDASGRNLAVGYSVASQVGRNFTGLNRDNNSVWLDATYSFTAPEALSLEESYAVMTNNSSEKAKYFLNATSDGNGNYTVTQNVSNGARIVPTGETGMAAFAIDNIFAGAVYDFDNFEVNAIDNSLIAPAVKGKDSNGNLKDIHANDNSTKVTVDAKVNFADDTFTVTFDYDATREAYGEFVGWYNGDELISTSKTASLPYSEYKENPESFYAVVEYENYMGNVGGFESYTKDNTFLMPELETITFENGETRQQYVEGPTGEYWGHWDWNTSFKLPDGITYDASVAEFITENGALSAQSNKGVIGRVGNVSINNASTSNVMNTASPYKGNNMGYMNSGTFIAVKAIEGLTPGKTYKISFHTTTLNTSDGRGIEAAAVTHTPLDFNCYNRGVGTATNRESNELLGYTYTQYTHPAPVNNVGVWNKIVLYFTATSETEYFWMRTPNSQTFVDEFVCKEFNEVNNTKTEWNFEDGDAAPEEFNTHRWFDMSATSTFDVVANDTNLDKLGNNYLNINTTTKSFNAINVNFNYNNNNRYILSFDMKVNSYAPYVSGVDNKIEIFASKMNNMGYYQTSHLKENAIGSNATLTRYYEDGKTYEKVVNPAVGGQFMFTTQATESQGSNLTFGDANGGAIWDQWQHFEVEIDPDETEYNGPATFGIFPTGAGWDISVDNIKVSAYSIADIEAADAATEGTKVFNIRAAGEGVEQGLRFKSTIDLDILDACGNGSKVVEYGTLVMDATKLNGHKLTRAVAMDKAKSGVAYVGVAYNRADGIDVQYALDAETNVLTYTGVITGIPTAKYGTEWAVRGYVIIEDANGNQTVVYDDIYTISLISAATYIVNESTDANDIAAAQTIIDTLN